MSTKEPISLKGFKKVEEELAQLIKVDRENIKEKISEARELGDLKENAEYHSAKEKQALIEGRISHLQYIVANSQIIDTEKLKSDSIIFGATVSLVNIDTDEKVTYQIVGKNESNTRLGKISYASPLGKALIGKEEGDSISVKAPKGDIEYEIERVEYVD